MKSDELEDRPTSIGGYGGIVPYHAPLTYDPGRGGESVVVYLPTEGYESPDQIVDRLNRAAKKIDVDLNPGQLYYSGQCQDFSWHGTGLQNLQSDLSSCWELSETIQATLKERYGSKLSIHRPCFVIIAPARFGIFWTTLRGFKDAETKETVYDVQAGVLMEDPVLSWPALEEMVDSDGPIPLVTTAVATANRSGNDLPLEEVIPVNHDRTGDADILSAKNVYQNQGVGTEDEIQQAIETTDRLTYRIKGGTIGFEKESEFRAQGMSLLCPQDLHLGGWPIVIGSPFCNAIPAE